MESSLFEPKMVKKDEYRGYEYFIVYANKAWYCAYVVLPESSRFYHIFYGEIPSIDVHGGLTFSDIHPMANNKWCIGWDYAHAGDYVPYFEESGDLLFIQPTHKWTVDEIKSECERAIDQIIELEQNDTCG